MERLFEVLFCPGCLRCRLSPIHWYLRLAGYCDGKNMSPS